MRVSVTATAALPLLDVGTSRVVDASVEPWRTWIESGRVQVTDLHDDPDPIVGPPDDDEPDDETELLDDETELL